MKHIILILSFVVSLLSGSGEGSAADLPVPSPLDVISEASSGNDIPQDKEYNSICLTSARGVSFSGERTSSAPTLRLNGSGRRGHLSSKFSFLIVKTGKVFDRQLFQMFFIQCDSRPSGLFCLSRLIYTIHYLLI